MFACLCGNGANISDISRNLPKFHGGVTTLGRFAGRGGAGERGCTLGELVIISDQF